MARGGNLVDLRRRDLAARQLLALAAAEAPARRGRRAGGGAEGSK
jgi:hypothetical protein